MSNSESWCRQQEIILKKWSEEAASYRYLHDRSFKKFQGLHFYYSLPVIILSTIAGTANFATGSFPAAWREYVSLTTGGLNLMAGMITTIAQFIKIPEMLESHRAASNDFARISRNIRVELSLPVRERSCSGREFLTQTRQDLEALMERAPDISLSLLRTFSSKFRKKDITMPDIIDLSTVEIFDDLDEMKRHKETMETQINDAAARMVEEKEKTKLNVGSAVEHLSTFMSRMSTSIEDKTHRIESDLLATENEVV
jgi:hypothetical protein